MVAGASVVVLGADDVLLVGLRVVVGSVVTGGRVVGLGDSEDSCPVITAKLEIKASAASNFMLM